MQHSTLDIDFSSIFDTSLITDREEDGITALNQGLVRYWLSGTIEKRERSRGIGPDRRGRLAETCQVKDVGIHGCWPTLFVALYFHLFWMCDDMYLGGFLLILFLYS